MNGETFKHQAYGRLDSDLALDSKRVKDLLSMNDFSDVSCGMTGEFAFPSFVIERKSDSGSLFFAQNQLIGALRCIFEAQLIAQQKLDQKLPVLALGLVNVGNWIEFWAAWRKYGAHIVYSPLFSHLFYF
jgi:hypothetical protein